MASNEHSTDQHPTPDGDIIKRFNEYVSAALEFESFGDLDNEQCPYRKRWNEVMEQMDAAPIPETAVGAALWIRFNLATNSATKQDAELLLHGTAARRAAHIRENRVSLSSEDRGQWFALAALEAQSPTLSLIEALHLRYEDAWREFHTIERRQIEIGQPDSRTEAGAFRRTLEDAALKNGGEIDALRNAILYQIPETREEALILAHHVYNAHSIGNEGPGCEEDKDALQAGFDALLHFLFMEVDGEGHSWNGANMLRLEELVNDSVYFRYVRRGEA